ncbi:MAG: PAS domain-containing protein [Nanoarchaeota archaeon]
MKESVTPEALLNMLEDLEKERKKAEERESTIKGILDTIPHAVIGLENRKILFANKAIETVFGYKPDEVIGKDTLILYKNNQDYEKIGNEFYPRLEKEKTHETEFVCKRKDGKEILCRVSASKIGDKLVNKKIVAMYEDISDKKKVEEDIKENEKKFQEILNNLIDGIVILDWKGTIIFANNSLGKMAGLNSGKELIGKNAIEFVHKDSKLQIIKDIQSVKSGKGGFIGSYKMVNPKGDIIYVETVGDKIIYEGKERILDTVRDVTEKKKMELDLKESDEKLKEIYLKSPIAIELYDSKGKLIDVNDSTVALFGLADKKDVRGFDLFKDPNIPSEQLSRLKKGESVSYDSEFDFDEVKKLKLYPTKKSGKIYISIILTSLGNKGDKGYLVQIMDITKRKLAEETLKKKTLELEKFAKKAIGERVNNK